MCYFPSAGPVRLNRLGLVDRFGSACCRLVPYPGPWSLERLMDASWFGVAVLLAAIGNGLMAGVLVAV
jgi:hypothetical protein